MKILRKFILLLVLSLVALFFTPYLTHAASTSVDSESALLEAIQSIEDGEVITLSNNIQLSRPIELNNNKNFTIDGDGHTVSRNTDSWQAVGPNATFFSVGSNTTVTFKNMTLENSQKYGVQAYNGGYVILDDVKIQNCGFGGVLVNAGTVEVKKLYLGHNGRADSNNGIEIAKSETISESENNPVLKMNGTLDSDQNTNVIYVDINDPIANFSVINTDETVNKVFLNGNQLVVTDINNNVIFESNPITGVDISSENFAKNIYLNLNIMDKTIAITVQEGQNLTEESVKENINLDALGLTNYTIEGFYLDNSYTAKVEFPRAFAEDTTIYVKLNQIEQEEQHEEQDTTPKTGIENTLEIALLTIALSIMAIITLKRKDN